MKICKIKDCNIKHLALGYYGIRNDNRIENLLLLKNRSEHQKIHEAKKILKE